MASGAQVGQLPRLSQIDLELGTSQVVGTLDANVTNRFAGPAQHRVGVVEIDAVMKHQCHVLTEQRNAANGIGQDPLG
jgi:hypothetical protein